jgi:hypothetical protein
MCRVNVPSLPYFINWTKWAENGVKFLFTPSEFCDFHRQHIAKNKFLLALRRGQRLGSVDPANKYDYWKIKFIYAF